MGGRSEGGRGDPSRAELERLRRENARLKTNLTKAEAIIEVQGKCTRSWRSLLTAAIDDQAPVGQLTIHADRGSSMTSKTVTQLLADLGVLQSHSRPHQSNDNPLSEAQFKTLKHWRSFPDRFSSIEAARVFCAGFFADYPHRHRHSGIALHTSADVHFGRAQQVRAARQLVLDAAFAARPDRFLRPLAAPALPIEAWINRPPEENALPHRPRAGGAINGAG